MVHYVVRRLSIFEIKLSNMNSDYRLLSSPSCSPPFPHHLSSFPSFLPSMHPPLSPPSSAVFTWTNLLVVVVELEGSEQEALDLVALVTNVVLEEHYLIVGVVVVVDPGVIPINSRGEKQRMHLRDGFLADQLDPIYVAYNM